MQNMLEIPTTAARVARDTDDYAIFIRSNPLPTPPPPPYWIPPRCCYVLFRMLLCKRQVFQPRATDMNTKCRPSTTRGGPRLPHLHDDDLRKLAL